MDSRLLLIGLGGALGALLRYGLSGWTYSMLGTTFPWGTLAVNLTGCFMIGFLWAAGEHFAFPGLLRAFLFGGMLGAFTTFSTFGLDGLLLLQKGRMGLGLVYVAASNLIGLLMVWGGLVSAGHLLPAAGG